MIRLLLSLIIVLLTCTTPTWAEPEQESLLAWLEITTAAGQADRLIAQSLDRYPTLTEAERSDAQSKLQAAMGSERLVKEITEALASQPLDWEGIESIYQQPIARRARNFEAALMLGSAADKFEAFRTAPPVSEERRALARRIDKVLQSSVIAVMLQNGIDAEVARLLGEAPLALSDGQREARRQAMEGVAESLYLYAYRFLKDDELARLVEAMESPAVRQLTDAAVATLPRLLDGGYDTVLTGR